MAESQVLMIELKKYGFRFYLNDNPEKSWFVNVNDAHPEYFAFVEEENREMKNVRDYKYEDFEVNNILELLIGMILRPNESFESLTGEKTNIKEIHIFHF
jgi:hypothetical protein